MRRYEGDDRYQDAWNRRGPKGKPHCATLAEAEDTCRDYFEQGCSEPLSIYSVADLKGYEPGFFICRGDETNAGRQMFGECRVRFVKVVPVPTPAGGPNE